MTNEPDIIKKLKEEEKLRTLHGQPQGSYEELEIPEEIVKDASDELVHVAEDDVEKKSITHISHENDMIYSKELERKFRLIAEKTSDLITTVTFTLNPTFTYVSPSHKKAVGYEPSDLIGKPFFDFVHPDDKKKLRSLLKKYISAKAKKILTGKDSDVSEKIEIRFRDKSGNWRYMETTANLIGEEILSVSRDVTERRRIDERFRMIANTSTDLIYEWNVKNDTLEWFGNFDEVLGYKESEIPRTIEAWVKLIHPDDLNKLKDSVELHRKSTVPIYEEYRVRKKDSTWLYWEDKGVPVLDENGLPVKWIGGCANVTERKKAEKELEGKIEELKRFKKVTVGRELKMIELKKRSKELEEG